MHICMDMYMYMYMYMDVYVTATTTTTLHKGIYVYGMYTLVQGSRGY